MKNFSNDCIDELKNHFDQLNSSCLANFTKAAEDLKNVQPQDLQQFAERHHREWESKGCICSSYSNYYDYYGNYWNSENKTDYWRGGCTDVPFSAVVKKTNKATGCNFHSVNWDSMNVTEVIMKMKDFSNDCIDELKNNFDQLNSTCLRNFTKAAEDLKNVQPQDLKKFAENHHMEWESEGCICPSHNYGYNGNNWNYWDPKNNTAYWRGGCTDVPFSAVVNKTNIATGCNFHSVNWDLMNVTEVIMKMKDFSNDCIDELKNNFDQLNSTCLRNFTKAAEDLKNVQPQDLKQFAENHHMEWELKGCICPSNDYGNNDKDGSHWNLINNTNYWRGGCTDVPFSAVVNKTNKPVCNFQSVHWDSMNVSDIIIKMKDFSNDCIDELKKHFDQLNSTCLRNFTMAAENLKNVQAQDLKQFAERHQIEWESKGCICPSQNHSGNYDHNRYDISSTRPLRTSTEFITTPTRCIPSAVQCSYAAQCPGCAGSASTCWVFDSQMQKCAVPGWESDHERAWQHFASRWASLGNRIAIKPYAATCDNFKALMKGYLTLQDSIKNSFNDYVLTENIPSDFDQIPVELFATINDTLLPRFINNLTDIQKLQMALKIESANATYYCSLRQILPGLNFETLYERLVDANVINPFNNDFLSGRTCEYYLSGTCSEIISNPVDLLRYAPNCLQKRSRCLSLSSMVLSNVQAIEADLSMACRNPYYSGFDLSYVSSLYMASVSTLTCTQNLLELVLYCDLETRILEPCSYAELSAVKDFTNSTAFDKLLASKLPADRSTLTSTQISEVLRGFTFSELELLNPDELKTAVCTGNVIDDLEKVEKEFIYEKLTSASVLNAGTDADCIDILDTGSIAKTKTSSELNQDFTSGKYADKEFDSDVAFAIAEKVQSSVTTISDLVTRKAVAKAFSSQTIKSATGTLTQTEIKSLSETFADITVCKAKKVTFIEKALTSSGGLASLVKTDISEEIPLSSFESATISDLDFLSETSTEVVTANLTVTQASSCWDKVVSASIQMNYAYVSRMKSIAGAMTKSQMDSVSTTSSLEMYRTMTVISESKTINGEKLSHIAQRVKSQVISDGAGSVDVFELSANVLIGMDTTTLSSFNNLEDVVSQMKSADIYKWGRRKLKDSGILTFIKSALGIESGTIDFISASKMGNLLQLLDPADFDRFNADAIKYAAERLKDVYLCSSMRTKLATVYSSVALSSSTFASTEELSDLGALAIDLDDAIFSTASTTMLKDGLKTIRESIDIRMVSRAMFESNGYKMECSEENDETLFETKMKTKFSSFITALTTTSVAGRRRRSTSSLTCSQMQLLGSSGLTAMTTTQISAMTDVDFTSCASLLGGVTGFSSDQLTALADVAKRATVWGDPSTWSTSSIQQAGVIAQALSTSEIQSMTWTIDDVSRMGDFSGWDETKKVTIISQWLSTQKSNNAGSITSSEMQSLGHMTCGLSTAQIQAITVYSAAADKIGEVTSCTELQMVEFANLAKTTYGSSVTSWSGTQIAAVGVHIGGLSKTELSSLVETQIDAILETHVSYIPATAFSGFTTAQISTFSTAQAQSTTSTQRDALTSAQLTALETAAGISFSSTVVAGDSDNSAGGVSITILPLITCLVAILFNHAGRQM